MRDIGLRAIGRDGDAVRRRRDRDIRDERVSGGVDHRDDVPVETGDEGLLSVVREHDIDGVRADGNGGDDRISRDRDHRHGVVARVSGVDLGAIRRDCYAVGVVANADCRRHRIGRGRGRDGRSQHENHGEECGRGTTNDRPGESLAHRGLPIVMTTQTQAADVASLRDIGGSHRESSGARPRSGRMEIIS